MSDDLLNYVVIVAFIAGTILLLAFVAGIVFVKKNKKDGAATNDLISYIKKTTESSRDGLAASFERNYNEESVDIGVLVEDERKLYQHLVKYSINKDSDLLMSTTTGIHSLVGNYIKLLDLEPNPEASFMSMEELKNLDDDSKESKIVILKSENEALRVETKSLEAKLKAATEAAENMMSELSSMFEGGHEVGDEKVKNEIYKFEQKLKGTTGNDEKK